MKKIRVRERKYVMQHRSAVERVWCSHTAICALVKRKQMEGKKQTDSEPV